MTVTLKKCTAWILTLCMVLTLLPFGTMTAFAADPDEAFVDDAYKALTWDTIKNTNTAQMSVVTDLTLPTAGPQSTAINWVSSNTGVISPDGIITRQAEDTYMTLNATISKGSVTSRIRTFYVCVRGTAPGSVTDAGAVAAMKAALTWDYIKNGNLIQGRVATNLFLPAQGLSGTDISWDSSLATAISTDGAVQCDGVVARNVTLTATIARGAASDTVSFGLTVPARYDFSNHIRPSIGNETLYPTKDYIVSDFNVHTYGAKTEPGFCNREAFQAAIDAAHAAGGGVVYAPAGTYEFHSEAVGEKRDHAYHYVLDLKESVQLRGDWVDPDTNGGAVQGTVFAVYAGHGSPNYNTYMDTGEIENQTGQTMLTNVSDRFIQMKRGTGVTNLSIWYPNQSIGGPAVKYPWTLFQTGGDSATLENVTLVNAYNGFHAAPSELHYILNSRITALETGIKIHNCTDTGRIERVNIGDYWSRSGLPGAPDSSAVTNYTKAHATGFAMHRSDWEYVAHLSVTGYKIGMWAGREYYASPSTGLPELAGYAPNAQFYGLDIQNCDTALYIDGTNGFGLLVSDAKIGGNRAAFIDTNTGFNTVLQFNGVDFSGPIYSDAMGGLASFENCNFADYNGTDAIQVRNNMNLLLAQSRFLSAGNHIYKANNSTVKAINSGYNGVLSTSGNTDNISQLKSDAYTVKPMPRGVKTDIVKHPAARANNVLRADLPRASGLNNDAPATDVSELLQNALNAMGAAGGGVVYLPGGRYLVNSPITVPSGVELRGTWDVPHHTEGGGAAIFTTYGRSADGAGASLIQLQEGAGLRGLSIVQINITDAASFNDNAPFLIQGQGPDVYVVNVTVPIGYRGIDLASYDTGGHYVDYFGGTLLKAGIWAGGGAVGGFIRNMQFNPHYALRRPSEGQGYPSVTNTNSALYNYTQGNCSALLFADVQDQTVFNSFAFGSVYGVHFKKDEITGKYPGRITLLGHGSDGCTDALYVEAGDENTNIIAINSALVNTSLTTQPERAYVRMGASTSADIHPETALILYNSAFWGSPTTGPIVNAGALRFHQANFHQMNGNNPGLNVNGGMVHVVNSYFAYDRGVGHAPNSLYLSLTGGSAELTNNCYRSNSGGGALQNERYSPNGDITKVYGSDIAISMVTFELDGVTEGAHTFYDTTPLSVQFKNTGETALSNLQITVTGDIFALGVTSGATVAPGETMNFTVVPKSGLAFGSYYAMVTITINGIPAGSFEVSYAAPYVPATPTDPDPDPDPDPSPTPNPSPSPSPSPLPNPSPSPSATPVPLTVEKNGVTVTLENPPSGDVTIEITVVEPKTLTAMQAAQVKGYKLVVDISVFVNDKKVDVPITISLPYTLKANENPAAVCVWHLDDNGKLTKLNGVYDTATGMITFTIDHQSYFVVGYDPVALWENIFGDLDPSTWYYDAVAYANFYNYIHGDGINFNPDGNLTRAMFATLVWKLEGQPHNNEQLTTFDDIPSDTWYTDAVLWAAENSIVQGTGNGFNPGKLLTRQEMVTLLYNYAVYKGYNIPVNQDTEYTDTDGIDAWAESAAKDLADAGVLNGFIGDEFAPTQTATRAEAAQLFKDFIRLITGE